MGTDVNAVLMETCEYTDAACTQEVKGSCLRGLKQPGVDADDYASTQTGYGSYVGLAEYKTCDMWAKAQYAKLKEIYDDDDDDYTEAKYLKAYKKEVYCFTAS